MASQIETSTANTPKKKMMKRRGAGRSGGSGSRQGGPFGQRLPEHHRYRMQVIPDRKDHHGIEMRKPAVECDICCRRSDLFAIGSCMHPICMECGVRLRILGGSDHCPKCRAQIDQMKFVEYKGDWSTSVTDIKEGYPHKDAERYNLLFESKYAADCFDSYLAHVCPICKAKGDSRVFATFALLNQHVYMVHQYFYCDICTKHLNVLTHERKVYSQAGLRRHLEKGDPDDASQKGHPQCLFCEKRFLDDEYRYKHLRRKHFFCQICDADGDSNYFYSEHADLIRHYKKMHVVCEEGECKQLGIAFRNNLELTLHKSTDHGAGKQNLSLDFHFDRSGASTSNNSRRSDMYPTSAAFRSFPRVGIVPNETMPPQRSDSTFTIVPSMQTQGIDVSLRYAQSSGFVVQGNDFPRLGSGLKRNDKKLGKNPKAGANKKMVTKTSESVSEGNASSSNITASTSWFIDDDEAFGRPGRSPSIESDSRSSSPSKSPTKSNGPAKPSYASAFRQPNSLSDVASVLRNPNAPNISAEASFPSLTPNVAVRNLPENSAWKHNRLHFEDKSQITGCIVPNGQSSSAISCDSSKQVRQLHVPDDWPKNITLNNGANGLDGSERAGSSEIKIGDLPIENKNKKKRGKKKKAKMLQQIEQGSHSIPNLSRANGEPDTTRLPVKDDFYETVPEDAVNENNGLAEIASHSSQHFMAGNIRKTEGLITGNSKILQTPDPQTLDDSSSKPPEAVPRNSFDFSGVLSSTFTSLMSAFSSLSTKDAPGNSDSNAPVQHKEEAGTKILGLNNVLPAVSSVPNIALPPPPGIVSVLPPGLSPPPGLGPPPGFEAPNALDVD